jgi:hypothetical protein
MKARLDFLALALLALSGCSWVSASTADYAAYRKTRVEPTFEGRIKAAGEYLAAHPSGAYRANVSAYMKKAEPVFYKTRETSLEGLLSYERALPNGAHAAEVSSRIRAIRAQGARPDGLVVAAKETEAKLARAAASREKARSELSFWVDMLSDRDLYKGPLAQGPAELVSELAALPAPRCRPRPSGESCEKDVSVVYTVPTERGLEERELGFVITIDKDETGRPIGARVEGEELFSRLEETYAKKALDSGAVRDRLVAVERGVDIVSTAFEARVSAEAACKQAVVAPEILHLACSGMRLRARAATDAGGIDGISFEPMPAGPSPAP